MRRLRIFIAMTCGVVAVSSIAQSYAQTCHDMPIALTAGAPRDGGAATLGISLTLRNQFTALPGGTFVGTNPQVGYQRGRWAALLGLPIYRTALGESVTGVGDLTMEGSVNVWGNQRFSASDVTLQ